MCCVCIEAVYNAFAINLQILDNEFEFVSKSIFKTLHLSCCLPNFAIKV